MAVHSVQDCSHCTKQKMTRAPSLETRVAAESIESYALKRLQYLALNLLIPRALFGFGRFFRRMRGRLRTSCCRRMRSRLRTGRGFSAGCSLLARRRLRVSCSRFGLRWTSLLGLRCSVLGRLVLVRASCRCLILGCLVLVRASCAALFSAALFSFERVAAALFSAALFSFERVAAALFSAALFSFERVAAALFSAALFSFERVAAALFPAALFSFVRLGRVAVGLLSADLLAVAL